MTVQAFEHVPDAVIITAAVVTALGVIWVRVVRPILKMLHRIESSLQYVEREMHFNGGTTQRDAIRRIDDAVRNLDKRLSSIETNTRKLEGNA